MAPIDPILLQQHHAALDRIDELLAQGRPVTNWTVPDEIAHFTYELARMAPENAIRAAKKFTEKIDKDNQKAAGELPKPLN